MPKGTVKAFLLISILLLMAPAREQSGLKIFKPVSLRNCINVIQVPGIDGRPVYQLQDMTLQERGTGAVHDLVLSFNNSAEKLRNDDSGKYRIRRANFLSARPRGTFGKGCAHFYRKSHRVVVETEESLWLGRCGDLGSFTFEFRFQAASLADMTFFSRTGFLSGSRRGIEIGITNGRVSGKFFQVFEDEKGNRKDIVISSRGKIRPRTWYHGALSFNRLTGKLSLHLNGRESHVRYITEDSIPGSQVLTPSFGHRSKEGQLVCIEAPPAVIGLSFSGYIDEFRIAYGDFSAVKEKSAPVHRRYEQVHVEKRTPYNVEGIITSPVYRFSDTGTRVLLFSWKDKLPQDTFLWMEFRISDHLFYGHDTKITWYRVKKNQRNIYMKKAPSGNYLRGRYYQWRAHLVPSPDGRFSPRLYNVSLRHQADPPPAVPLFIQVVAAGDEKIVLRWKKNTDSDLGGYRIHYGIVPGRFDGIISTLKGKVITNTTSDGKYVRVTIDNSIINENKERDLRKILSFPGIKNTVLYYFAVSAYDTYRKGTPYSHESQLSKVVSARPFGGSEID